MLYWGLMGPNKKTILIQHSMQHHLKSVQKKILVIGNPTLRIFFFFSLLQERECLPLWTCRQCWCRGCSSCQALCWWRLGCLWQQRFPSAGSCTLEIGSPTKFHSFVGIEKENAFRNVMHQKYLILKCGKMFTCSGSSRNSSRNREWQTLQNRFASPQMTDRWKIYPASIDQI